MPLSNTRGRWTRAKETREDLGAVGRPPSHPVLITAREMITMIAPTLQMRKKAHSSEATFPGDWTSRRQSWGWKPWWPEKAPSYTMCVGGFLCQWSVLTILTRKVSMPMGTVYPKPLDREWGGGQ